MKRYMSLVMRSMCIPIIAMAQTYVLDSLYSSSLGLMRYMRVCLPAGYDTSTMYYPVIYFLHGANTNHNGYPEIYSIVNDLTSNNIIEPLIVIQPDGSIGPYGGSCYTNSELYGAFEDYIAYDLIDYIDSTYRTLPVRGKRCIMGHSMGGYGAFRLALKHPDIYRGLADHSGTVDMNVGVALWTPHILAENAPGPPYTYSPTAGTFSWFAFTASGACSPDTTNPPYFVDFVLDSMGNVDSLVWIRWEPHDIPRLAAQLPPDTNLYIYFDCGTVDQYECYPMHVALAESLDLLNIDYEFQSYIGNHTNLLMQRFPIAITFLDSIMRTGIEEDAGNIVHESSFHLRVSPNPFSTRCVLKVQYAPSSKHYAEDGNSTKTELNVYDISGRVVKSFSLPTAYGLLPMVISWSGRDDQDRVLPSGVYFVRLTADEYCETKKVLLMR